VREKNKPKYLAGIHEAKKKLGGNMRRLDDIINVDLKYVGYYDVTCRYREKHRGL
jgi:hypothetical protein